MRNFFIFLAKVPIKVYQYCVSPYLPANCRYQPTCSAYALEALELHGPVKGTWLTLRRLGRCHPWGGHGYDPVPNNNSSTSKNSNNCHHCRTQSSDSVSIE